MRSPLLAPLGLLASAVILAGCGNDTTGDAANPASSPSAPVVTLSVADPTPSISAGAGPAITFGDQGDSSCTRSTGSELLRWLPMRVTRTVTIGNVALSRPLHVSLSQVFVGEQGPDVRGSIDGISRHQAPPRKEWRDLGWSSSKPATGDTLTPGHYVLFLTFTPSGISRYAGVDVTEQDGTIDHLGLVERYGADCP